MDGFQRIGGLIMNTSLTSLLPSQQMLSSDISAITNIRLDSVKRTIERLAERRHYFTTNGGKAYSWAYKH
jgi:transcription initiation factor IIE alpha subunit